MTRYDVIVIGAGASGLMCAIEAGKRGRKVLLLDHAKRIGEKIRISGGGRCNFTNLYAAPDRYLSENPRFCISALKSYTQQDFIGLVRAHGIAFHEKTPGQLFCDGPAQQIIDMLTGGGRAAGADIRADTEIRGVTAGGAGFAVETSQGRFDCSSLVVATGGRSVPKIGATDFGYRLARQFGLDVIAPRPGLVPLTFDPDTLESLKGLAGIAVEATVSFGKTRFNDALLFTHRGLSGPAILQISSYWRESQPITVDMAPGTDLFAELKAAKAATPRQEPQTVLAAHLPKRLAQRIAENAGIGGRLADIPDKRLRAVAESVNAWRIVPQGSEGYRTAEVTTGGVDTRTLSSKTMECRGVPGLYFIGEAVDITGHLGGFNFQWAWSSGVAAGRAA